MNTYFKSATTICALLILTACTSNGKKDVDEKSDVDENQNVITLESIKLKSLSGEEIDMKDFKDKVVFINFWATWCKPCIREMPTIESAQSQLKNENVVFLLASNESVEQIESFKVRRTFQLQFVQVQNLEALNIQALPATYIFSKEGDLVFSEVGFRMWDTPENLNLITKDSNL